jgi:hypothetical protein
MIHHPYYPPRLPQPPVRHKRPARTIALVALSLLVAVLVVLVVVLLHYAGNNRSVASSTQTASLHTGTGTPQEWFGAVCLGGTFHEGMGGLPSAANEGACVSKAMVQGAEGPRSQHGLIVGGSYVTPSEAENDAAILHSASRATVFYHGMFWMFLAFFDKDEVALQPLSRYGFTIGPFAYRGD